MQDCKKWTLLLAVSLISVLGSRAEVIPVTIAGKSESLETTRMEAQKKHEAEERQKRLDQVKKQIVDRQADIENTSKMIADKRNEDMLPFFEKQLEFSKAQLSLYQEMQMALEGQSKERIEKVYAQIRDLNVSWKGMGEMLARMDAERARAKKMAGENPAPEIKAALDDFNAACDGIQKDLEKKQALEKDLMDLNAKQREAMEKLHKASRPVRAGEKEKAVTK